MLLETKLTARFVPESAEEMTAEKRESMKALNIHTEEITEKLQEAFRLLVIEMLELKREQYTKGEDHEGSE